jgi:hypothetical protein
VRTSGTTIITTTSIITIITLTATIATTSILTASIYGVTQIPRCTAVYAKDQEVFHVTINGY